MPERLPHRNPQGLALFHQQLRRGGAQPPGRRVEDAQQLDVVLRLDKHGEVGEHVLDLAAVEETLPADHAVGDALGPQPFLEEARLLVGAEQDREILPRPPRGERGPLDLADHELRLGGVARQGDQADLVLARQPAPERLAAPPQVVPDDAVGGVQDGRGAAVILLEADDLRVLEEALEREQVLDLGPAPPVDALVVVAHHADVAGGPHEVAQQVHLQAVGVLELVHQDVVELVAPVRPHVGVIADDLHGEDEEVVEIDRVHRLLLGLVVAGHGDQQFIVLLAQGLALVLGHADAGDEAARIGLLVEPAAPHQDAADQRALLALGVDREVPLVAEAVDRLAEDADAERMERAQGKLRPGSARHHAADALAHLVGGLVGEGDGQDVLGRHSLVQHVRDPRREHAGLAGARPRQHQHRPMQGQHRLALLRVEFRQIEAFRHRCPGRCPRIDRGQVRNQRKRQKPPAATRTSAPRC